MVCLEGPPQRQCYTAPKDYGNNPIVKVVELQKGMPALFFSAETGGIGGSAIHFAILRAGTGRDLEDLLGSEATVSNQSQHVFWSDPSISEAPIFLTPEYTYGPGESHYDEHRYIISSYPLGRSIADNLSYYLGDRFMTIRKYDYESVDILAAEKPEILSRLRRVKSAR